MKKLGIALLLGLTAAFANAGGSGSKPGPQGLTGNPGINGQDAESHTDVIAGVDVRVLDYQHVAVHLFDDYNVRDGRNDSVGARIAFKVGKSWEEKLDEDQDRIIAELKQTILELKSVAHRPGVHQEKFYPEFNDDFYLYDKAMLRD